MIVKKREIIQEHACSCSPNNNILSPAKAYNVLISFSLKGVLNGFFLGYSVNQGLGKRYQPSSADNDYQDLDYSGYHRT